MDKSKSIIDELYSAGKDCLWDYEILSSDVRHGVSVGNFDVNRAMNALGEATYHFLDMAARNGHALAAFKLYKLCQDSDLPGVDSGLVRRGELREQAMEGMVKQAEENPSLAFGTGFAYLYESHPNDIDKAERCFKAGAKKNDASCIWQLGEIAKKKGEMIHAFHFYLKAANLGQGMAMFEVGQCFEKGEGTPADRGEAIRWYKRCAKSSYAAASDAKERLKALGKK